jgi:hypothetical protein
MTTVYTFPASRPVGFGMVSRRTIAFLFCLFGHRFRSLVGKMGRRAERHTRRDENRHRHARSRLCTSFPQFFRHESLPDVDFRQHENRRAWHERFHHGRKSHDTRHQPARSTRRNGLDAAHPIYHATAPIDRHAFGMTITRLDPVIGDTANVTLIVTLTQTSLHHSAKSVRGVRQPSNDAGSAKLQCNRCV